MEIKLIDYIKNNIDKLSNGNILCYITNDIKDVMNFALYQKDDKLYLYFNCLYSFEIDLNDNDNYYLNKTINEELFVEIKSDEWVTFLKKSIENSINKNSKIYKSITNEAKFNGGRLVKIRNNTIGMFVAETSSDEDYYYLVVYEENNEIKLSLETACGNLNYIMTKDYSDKEYELINFINLNKQTIIDKINSLPTDVVLNGIHFNKKLTKK